MPNDEENEESEDADTSESDFEVVAKDRVADTDSNVIAEKHVENDQDQDFTLDLSPDGESIPESVKDKADTDADDAGDGEE